MSRVKVLDAAIIVLAGTSCASAEHTTAGLRPCFDNDGVSYAANLTDGDFSFRCSYAAEETPAPGRCAFGGVPFECPDYHDGLNNCAKLCGEAIDLSDRSARTICVLGASLFSKHTSARAMAKGRRDA